MISGGILGWSGSLAQFSLPGRLPRIVLFLGVVALILSGNAAGLIRIPIPESRWQVPRKWLSSLPQAVGAGLFGICLGAGVMTRITITLYVVLVWALVSGSAQSGAIAMAVYALCRTIPLWVLYFMSKGDGEKRYRYAMTAERWGTAASLVSALALTATGSFLVISSVR
jgi:cytochrome c biogenesis protein CcdA